MASTYLSKTFGTATDRKKWTFSAWVKRSTFAVGEAIFASYAEATQSWYSRISDNGNGKFDFSEYDNSSYVINLRPNALLRDVNGWYHLVLKYDSAQATASDRVKYYVNGEQITSWSSETYPSQNQESGINKAQAHTIGKNLAGPDGYYFNGYMAHFHFCDGYAYDASTFGETDATTGIWKPITEPSVNYGNNGFFLKFENSGSMGLDSSGNSNNFAVNGNLTQTVDTPTNVYAVLNILNPQASGYTIANGNLSVTANASDTWRTTYSTIGASSGKWYWEQKITNFTGVDPHYIGIVSEDQMNSSNIDQASTSRGYFYTATGAKRTNNAQVSYGDSWTTGDIVGVAMDLDNNKLYFSKNGTWQNSGDPTSGATGTGSAFDITSGYVYLASTSTYYSGNTYQMNFGNGYFGTTPVSSAGSNGNGSIFEYDVPTGYYALNTKNLATYG